MLFENFRTIFSICLRQAPELTHEVPSRCSGYAVTATFGLHRTRAIVARLRRCGAADRGEANLHFREEREVENAAHFRNYATARGGRTKGLTPSLCEFPRSRGRILLKISSRKLVGAALQIFGLSENAVCRHSTWSERIDRTYQLPHNSVSRKERHLSAGRL